MQFHLNAVHSLFGWMANPFAKRTMRCVAGFWILACFWHCWRYTFRDPHVLWRARIWARNSPFLTICSSNVKQLSCQSGPHSGSIRRRLVAALLCIAIDSIGKCAVPALISGVGALQISPWLFQSLSFPYYSASVHNLKRYPIWFEIFS